MSNEELLREKIEMKRNQMIINGAKYGLSHEATVNTSQELDVLLNMYVGSTTTKIADSKPDC